MSDEQISLFQNDFGIVANFISKKNRNPDYIPDDPRNMIHPDEVLKMIANVVKDTRYLHLNDQNSERKVANMCEVADKRLEIC